MRVEKFNSKESGFLIKILQNQYPLISYSSIKKILRKKDIKINGKRISEDLVINKNDEVVFYIDNEIDLSLYEDLYEDDNILIVYKKRGVEVVSEVGNDLLSLIKNNKNTTIYPVHRLDRNTEGIVIFAKNKDAKSELDYGFKNRTFEKFYLTLAYGLFEKKSENLVAYLKKDAKESVVYISDEKLSGYDEIKTNYKVLKQFDDSALLEVELISGKTHQIRAHLAHIGHFVIGDDKYGDSKINKQKSKKYQNLTAYKIILHFLKNSKLSYLDGFIIEIPQEKIPFLKNLT